MTPSKVDLISKIKNWKKPLYTVVQGKDRVIRFPLQRNQLIRMLEEDNTLNLEIRTTCHWFSDYGKSIYVFVS